MKNVVIISFTERGYLLAKKVEQVLNGCKYLVSIYKSPRLIEVIPNVFKKGNTLVFIGAVGIAVRAVADNIKNKAEDSAVVVMDEHGKYVIPILSGHIGGANIFSEELSQLIGATAVITTATDINNVFSIDTYAVQNKYAISDTENIKHISAALLNGEEVGLCTQYEVNGQLPKGLALKNSGDLGVFIGTNEILTPFSRTLRLMPKCFHVGIGAKRGIPFETLSHFFLEVLQEASIPICCIGSFSSIDLKKDEEAIVTLSKAYDVEFITYSADELKIYEGLFPVSNFVKEKTGVGNVCEISAYLASKKGTLLIRKKVKNGITIAIATEDWRVSFGDTNDGHRL